MAIFKYKCKVCLKRAQSVYRNDILCQKCANERQIRLENKFGYKEKSLMNKMYTWQISPKRFRKEIRYLWCLNQLDRISAIDIFMIAHIYVEVTGKPEEYSIYAVEKQWRKMLNLLYFSLNISHKKLENLID